MRNRRILIAISLMAAGVVSQNAYADQGYGGKAPMVRKSERMTEQQIIERRLSYLTQKLELTAEQQTAIKPILEAERGELYGIANDKTLTAEQKKVKLQELRDATFDKVSTILTPDQRQKHDNMRKQASERSKNRDGK